MAVSVSLSRFAGDLRMANRASGTIKQYLVSARKFEEYLGCELDEASQESIRRWVDHLRLQSLSESRLGLHYSALKFLYGRTLGQPEKVAWITIGKDKVPLPVILTRAEVSRLLDSLTSAKYRTFFTLIYATGLRVQEACLLETRDIDAMQQVIHVRNGKGGRNRMVPMSGKLYGLLRAYFKHERPPQPWLFASGAGKHICLDTARRALLHATACASIGRVVTPHMLRHAFATHLLEQGTDLRKIQVLLGHNCIQSTTIYTHVVASQIAAIRSPFEDLPD